MGDKKEESNENIQKRIDALTRTLQGSTQSDWVAILLRGKTPKYNEKFAGWAKNTLASPYFEDMVGAMVVSFAMLSLISKEGLSDEFVKGQADAVLFMFEEMQRLSNVEQFKE